jgi:(p)ppGpp synthase/HD superfamily hydrolase
MNAKINEYDAERDAHALLPRAIEIATEQHAGQVDKAGRPYIEHPMRVMRRMRTNVERIVAVLHDVIEDGTLTLSDLAKEGFSREIRAALDSVTRRPGEDYTEFTMRAAANPIGRWVKYEDLRDNADLARITEPTNVDLARALKYQRAMAQLEAAQASKV